MNEEIKLKFVVRLEGSREYVDELLHMFTLLCDNIDTDGLFYTVENIKSDVRINET